MLVWLAWPTLECLTVVFRKKGFQLNYLTFISTKSRVTLQLRTTEKGLGEHFTRAIFLLSYSLKSSKTFIFWQASEIDARLINFQKTLDWARFLEALLNRRKIQTNTIVLVKEVQPSEMLRLTRRTLL